ANLSEARTSPARTSEGRSSRRCRSDGRTSTGTTSPRPHLSGANLRQADLRKGRPEEGAWLSFAPMKRFAPLRFVGAIRWLTRDEARPAHRRQHRQGAGTAAARRLETYERLQ